MTDQSKPVSRPWRRFLRFSVRRMVVVVLLIGVLLGWIARVVRTAQAQRDAVTAIQKSGGSVCYDWEWRNQAQIEGGKPWAPELLVDVFGADYFGHVTVVYLLDASDRELLQLESLVQIQWLVIVDPHITDASLVHLKPLTRLRSLTLRGEKVTDAEIDQLKGLTNLEWLDLGDTQVTDAGLSDLEGLTKLSVLSLMNAQVTDDGLVRLRGLTNLTELILLNTKVTDAGLTHLKGLTNLSKLHLGETQVTEAGVNELKQALPRLTVDR